MPTQSERSLLPRKASLPERCRFLAKLAVPCLAGWITTQTPAIAAGHQSSVLVEVRHVKDPRGHVLVALCTQPTFLTASCPYHAAAPATMGTVVVRIDGVSPGSYGVQAFHDFNDTKTLERTFFGLPTKGLGFSRDAPMRFGPPRFDDAAFEVDNAATASVVVTLRYY